MLLTLIIMNPLYHNARHKILYSISIYYGIGDENQLKTDPIKRALELRKTLISDNKVLVVDFSDTLQGKDTSKVVDLMPIVGTKYYPFRTKVNVKGIDPLASDIYSMDFFNVLEKSDNEIESYVKRQEFDFPLWFKHDGSFNMKDIQFYNLPFIMQVAGCNFHDGSSSGGCWYCFVDDISNDGKPGKGKVMLDIEDTISSMSYAREKVRKQYRDAGYDMDLKVLRTSGGEPTIVLDWVLKLWDSIDRMGMDYVGQLDSNLSTARVVDDFEKRGVFEPHTLEKLAGYPVKLLTALKGVDDDNIQDNVQSESILADQEYCLRRFVKAGFDIYPQMYNPNPENLRPYLERLDGTIENFSLRVHIGPLKIYGPTTHRLTLEAKRLVVEPESFVRQHKEMWDSNFQASNEVLDIYLQERYGVGYKEVTRSDVILKLK
jgi:hypothetical protein